MDRNRIKWNFIIDLKRDFLRPLEKEMNIEHIITSDNINYSLANSTVRSIFRMSSEISGLELTGEG